ncbi:MAG TPA: DinB family protein [Desertimonas sp.]|nr:DinB family protein [Desertimonas sp.]
MDDDSPAVVDWHGQLVEQLDWHWRHFARPRLDGLTDEEYRWEPVPGCWNVRPRESGSAPIQAGSGEFTCDFAVPEPDPPPVTTIAWRLAHVTVGVFGARAASHFGGPPIDYPSYEYPGDAATALDNLDAVYASWVDGVNALDSEGLARPVGPAEGSWQASPMVGLVLHINREAIHHLAEVALLRDLFAHR